MLLVLKRTVSVRKYLQFYAENFCLSKPMVEKYENNCEVHPPIGSSMQLNGSKQFVVLTLCILETPNWVFLKTVKTQMKCHITRHFIRVRLKCSSEE